LNLAQYFEALSGMHYGKRLPSALYIFRPTEFDLPLILSGTVKRAEIAASPDPQWNLLKFHTDQHAITFLSYPEFDSNPHPSLTEATKINLNSGTVVKTDYRTRSNPPILHRKEAFLPNTDPRIRNFAALTKQEEEAGLYRDTSRIGLRIHWQTLLKRKGLTYEGHLLIPTSETIHTDSTPYVAYPVERHRTAIKRYDLSKPIKTLLERGLLRKTDAFFDFGCGHGMDIEGLNGLGYNASGWDPAFRPDSQKNRADVVNLGYVLNVIEDSSERISVLKEAYGLADKLLLVSTLVSGQETDSHARPYRDGYLTKTNTFQKFYAPGELEELIEKSLEAEAVTVGLGICAVFRRSEEAELFEAGRNRRRIDWSEISSHMSFSTPASRERRQVGRYELHKTLFDDFWNTLLDLGRAPEPGEFDRLPELKKASGGINRAMALVVSQHGDSLLKVARQKRTEDVLVYLAIARFRKHFKRRDIPLRTKNDIRSFFGDVSTAQARSRDLLFAAGDPGEIALACEDVSSGWQNHDSLTIHRSLFADLPPILRIYVQCAAHRYGDPAQADLIKIHKHSGKVSFQHYDDFDEKDLPELQLRIKVNLRNLFVQVFDQSKEEKKQLLYFKERFVGSNYHGRKAMENFSTKLRKLGLSEETIGHGIDKSSLIQALNKLGLTLKLTRIKKTHTVPPNT
jgi:DNA phosphorothioation-associated putative methyltransferase